MKLIPVVEFEPYTFKTEDRESPSKYGREDPHSWDKYWRECLADSDIINIDPYEIGSWLVEIDRLTPEILAILLDKTYKKESHEADADLEEILGCSLSGGYVLEVPNIACITPQCCGDLEDINNWETASDWKNKEEMTLWIGHPWLMVSSLDDRLIQIRRTAEYGEPEQPELVIIDRHELKQAIVSAKQKLNLFKQIVVVALQNIFPHLVNELSLSKLTNWQNN